MPREEITQTDHRCKLMSGAPEIYPACVARKVPRNEWNGNKAQEALEKEWNRLRFMPWPDHATSKKKGTWDESKVMEAKDVRDLANSKPGQTAHFARIAELLYEKGSELPANDPARKMKGRAVLLGDNIKDLSLIHISEPTRPY